MEGIIPLDAGLFGKLAEPFSEVIACNLLAIICKKNVFAFEVRFVFGYQLLNQPACAMF
ncbi:hypothetical protein QQ991_07480 [Weizmannia coagulans]|uniref:Uncharacterized protein n=1 Tax=Heyndrickxia faecalis TaxID=2824910 RepID=A0ABV3NL18_9BACI|nr:MULTISPECIES: hypothetical protein [Heyndrickxia]MCR4445855.1 hypothetical protein [Heyndrickxia coagulans]MCW8783110.1 hypothetical protein [Heyndrickxia coagulans]MDL4844659.1 hypothetical protein [Heyndrickxia coagulans]MED4891046.1 hypothetical protein [Weizmannia sp. CD-2023]UYT05877.1 hypothetical protein OF158_05590 [Weizmannia sp. WK01]